MSNELTPIPAHVSAAVDEYWRKRQQAAEVNDANVKEALEDITQLINENMGNIGAVFFVCLCKEGKPVVMTWDEDGVSRAVATDGMRISHFQNGMLAKLLVHDAGEEIKRLERHLSAPSLGVL